ncbi:unnamed protein product [Kuraishia capsulata CBS 1993]|uniref:SCD domain-containing protein n=1 Tax=Kuraishia capsulata CBS 1993 TaxID=1382522 RepID=W6MGV6_9ASCO|nr:uncharacterized protein KUCA_T00001078001 [Kuraishia capsulata CBS 1993]CDK25111.1 unnamed protein product [Kuraishia capsulata CBS 1993]
MSSVVISTPTPPRRSRRIQSLSTRRPTPQPQVSDLDESEDAEEDEEEDGDEDGEDEEDESDYGTTNKKRVSSTASKTRAKGTQKRQKTLTGNIDEIEDFHENYLFQALSDPDTALVELVDNWMEEYAESRDLALMNIVNFVLRSCGSVVQIQEHDVASADSVEQTVAEVQDMMMRQKYHEFGMMSGTAVRPEWKNFRANSLEFFDRVLRVAAEKGLLNPETALVENFLEWISSMCTSNLRNLRFTAVLFALQMGTTLSEITARSSLNANKQQTRLDAEIKRLDELERSLTTAKRGEKAKIQKEIEIVGTKQKTIAESVESYKKDKFTYETYLKEVLSATFAHRYRDTDHAIRQECIVSLGRWMELYPEMFLESSYLRYMGWLLSDTNAHVRLEVTRHLLKLYKKSSAVTVLSQFTERFKKRMVEMVLYDVSYQVKITTITLLIEIYKKGLLENEEVLRLSAFMFVDEHDAKFNLRAVIESDTNRPYRWRNEIAKLVSYSIEDRVNEVIKTYSDSIEECQESFVVDVKEAIHAKATLNVMAESYHYYTDNFSTPLSEKDSPEVCFSEKLALFAKHLFVSNLGPTLEFSIKYLSADTSLSEDIDEEFRSQVTLSSNEARALLNYVYGSTSVFLKGPSNGFYVTLLKSQLSKKLKRDSKDGSTLTEAYNSLSHTTVFSLISAYPELLSKFKSVSIALPILLTTFNKLSDSDSFTILGMESAFDKICLTFMKLFGELPIGLVYSKGAMQFDSLKWLFKGFFSHVSSSLSQHPELALKLEDFLIETAKGLRGSTDELLSSEPLARYLCLLQSDGIEVKAGDAIAGYISTLNSELIRLQEQVKDGITEAAELSDAVELVEGLMDFLMSFAFSRLQKLNQAIRTNSSGDPLELEMFQTIMSSLGASAKSQHLPDLELRLSAISFFLDFLTAFKLFETFVNGNTDSELCARLEHFIDTECPAVLDTSVERSLLQLFLKLEAKLGSLLKVELDRDEFEDVNFHIEETDVEDEERQKRIWDCEKPLVVLTLKLLQLESTGLLSKPVAKRLRLNAKYLGDVYKSVFFLAGKDEKTSKRSRTETPATSDPSELEDLIEEPMDGPSDDPIEEM